MRSFHRALCLILVLAANQGLAAEPANVNLDDYNVHRTQTSDGSLLIAACKKMNSKDCRKLGAKWEYTMEELSFFASKTSNYSDAWKDDNVKLYTGASTAGGMVMCLGTLIITAIAELYVAMPNVAMATCTGFSSLLPVSWQANKNLNQRSELANLLKGKTTDPHLIARALQEIDTASEQRAQGSSQTLNENDRRIANALEKPTQMSSNSDASVIVSKPAIAASEAR
jgi:hypothetical protein